MRYLLKWFASLFATSTMAVKCGHRTRRSGRVSAFGKSIHTSMKPNKDGSVDYCLACLGKMAILCSCCPRPIFIGDPIVLYYNPGRVDAVILGNGPAYLGCVYCSNSAANVCGFWIPGEDGKGKVLRTPNGYEIALGAIPSGA